MRENRLLATGLKRSEHGAKLCEKIGDRVEDPKTHWMDSGEKIGMTMGEFVGILIDGGRDTVIVSAQDITEDDDQGEFIMKLEVYLVPEKDFSRIATLLGVKKVMDRLALTIGEGLVK